MRRGIGYLRCPGTFDERHMFRDEDSDEYSAHCAWCGMLDPFAPEDEDDLGPMRPPRPYSVDDEPPF